MWEIVARPWQAAFEQGWEAFKNKCLPIGAVITDENGNIISSGRSHQFDNTALNPNIAHAESEALQKLDLSKYPNVVDYTLYACMEPCPMCMGTFVMSNLRKLKVAARDSYCGAVHYSKEDPYMISQNLQIDFELGILETVQLAIQVYFELRLRGGKMNRVTDTFNKDNPKAIEIAKKFYEYRYLDTCVEKNAEFGEIYNKIHMIWQ